MIDWDYERSRCWTQPRREAHLDSPESPVADRATAPAPLDRTELEEMVKQWRGAADWMMGSTEPSEWQRGGSGYLRQCADTLEAALRAVPSRRDKEKGEL